MNDEEDEMPRQRTTWRLSNANYDFVMTESQRLSLSMNAVLNILLGELRTQRCQSDSTVTAKLANKKSVQ